MPARFWAALWLAVLAPASASAAGGAYVVDGAEVGKPGECKVESWVALASNHDLQAITQPACVAKLGIPIELTAAYARSRSDGEWQNFAGGKAKINLVPVENGRIGVALVDFAVWDARTGQNNFNALYVPLTYQFSDNFRVNINAGWQYDGAHQANQTYWGAGFEWNFVQPLTLIGELFQFAGPRVDPTSFTEPRAQLGLRITPVKNLDIDLIYGRNVYGENANWFTLGLNVRF